MSNITAAQVKELRDATKVGMMECKKALVDAEGDFDAAMKFLREAGIAIAGKKADRVANEGLIAADVIKGGKLGVIVEVNCETDFVARNETFQTFVAELLEKAKTLDGSLAEACKDELVAKIAETGENLIINRHERFEVQGTGIAASYIHLGGKIGVLAEIGCNDDASLANEQFREMAKDITLHIAASKPDYLTREDVPADITTSEREIFAKQAEGKPENIVEKIVAGKIEKFYATNCLMEQGFIKDPDQSITDLLASCGKEIGDSLSIRRYLLYRIGI